MVVNVVTGTSLVTIAKILTQDVIVRLFVVNSFAIKAQPFAIKAKNGEQVELFIVFKVSNGFFYPFL